MLSITFWWVLYTTVTTPASGMYLISYFKIFYVYYSDNTYAMLVCYTIILQITFYVTTVALISLTHMIIITFMLLVCPLYFLTGITTGPGYTFKRFSVHKTLQFDAGADKLKLCPSQGITRLLEPSKDDKTRNGNTSTLHPNRVKDTRQKRMQTAAQVRQHPVSQ